MRRTGVLDEDAHVSLCDHLCNEAANGLLMIPLCGAKYGAAVSSVSGTICPRCAAQDKAPRDRVTDTPEKQRRADARIAKADAERKEKPPEPTDEQAPLF